MSVALIINYLKPYGIYPMKITRNLTLLVFILLLAAWLSNPAVARASEEKPADEAATAAEPDGNRYLPSDDSMADVVAVMDSARENNKLVLVVMGANWCHDSRALASRLQKEPLNTLVDDHYETVFVDVGFLEKGKDVITSLGPPVYYATPTVLIVDPVTGRLINEHNRHQWANANSISMDDSVEYFRQMSRPVPDDLKQDVDANEDLQELLAEIEAFEQLQAERVYEAYIILSPMLRAYENGEKDKFSEQYWDEVRDFRYKIPADVETLRAKAQTRVAAGESNINLTYPEYPAFSWEEEQ
jgi:hypothetical protein